MTFASLCARRGRKRKRSTRTRKQAKSDTHFCCFRCRKKISSEVVEKSFAPHKSCFASLSHHSSAIRTEWENHFSHFFFPKNIQIWIFAEAGESFSCFSAARMKKKGLLFELLCFSPIFALLFPPTIRKRNRTWNVSARHGSFLLS